MKFLGTSIKFNKKLKRFGLFFLLLGILLGFLLYLKVDNSVFISQIKNIGDSLENGAINFIFIHGFVLLFLICTSFSVVGILFFLVYFLFELACITYSSFIFMEVFGFSGLVFGLLYNIVIKLFYLVFLLAIFKRVYFIVRWKFFHNENGNDEGRDISFKRKYLEIIRYFIGVFLYDVFLYFEGSKILLKLTNIL